MSAEVPKYVENLCAELIKVIQCANSEEIAAVRHFLLEAAKATLEMEVSQYVRMGR